MRNVLKEALNQTFSQIAKYLFYGGFLLLAAKSLLFESFKNMFFIFVKLLKETFFLKLLFSPLENDKDNFIFRLLKITRDFFFAVGLDIL